MRYGMYTDSIPLPIALPSPAYKPPTPVPRERIDSRLARQTGRQATLPALRTPASYTRRLRNPERVSDVHRTPETRLRRMRVTWTECYEARGKGAARVDARVREDGTATRSTSLAWRTARGTGSA